MQVGGWISFMWLVYLVLRCSSFSLHKASDCCVGALQEVGETECHLGNLKSFLTDAAFVYPRGPTAVKQKITETPQQLGSAALECQTEALRLQLHWILQVGLQAASRTPNRASLAMCFSQP